jgi:hypothetical protein
LPNCVEFDNLTRGQIAAFQFHGHLVLTPAHGARQCNWLLVDATTARPLPQAVDKSTWTLKLGVRRRADNGEAVQLYQRITP